MSRKIERPRRLPPAARGPTSEGRALRDARVRAGLSLREAAKRLRWSAVELGEVERGVAGVDDWEAVWARLGTRPQPGDGERRSLPEELLARMLEGPERDEMRRLLGEEL